MKVKKEKKSEDRGLILMTTNVLEDGVVWATSGGQVNFDLEVGGEKGRLQFPSIPSPGCECTHSHGHCSLHTARYRRPGQVEEGPVVDGHPSSHDGLVEKIVPCPGHSGAGGEEV